MSKQVEKNYRAHEDEQVQAALSLIAEMMDPFLQSYYQFVLTWAMYAPPDELEHIEWEHLHTLGELLWAIKQTPEGMGLQK